MDSTATIPTLDAPPLLRNGYPYLVTPASPAAGASYSYQVPGNYFMRPISVYCKLVADANVASREVVVEYQTAEGTRFDLSGVATTVVASNTGVYVFSAFQALAEFTVDGSALVPLHPTLLMPTEKLAITVVNVQATDQLSQIRIRWEQFFSDSPVPGA